jgi:TonB family protein
MRSRWRSAALVVSLLVATNAARAATGHAATNPRAETVTVQNQFPSGPKIQTFMGRVLSQNDVRFIFRDDASDVWYHLDDQDKAKVFFGKDVVITGTIDGLTGTIRMQSIRLRTVEDRLPDPPSPPEQPVEPEKESPAIAPASEKSAVISRPKEAAPIPAPRSTPPPAVTAANAPSTPAPAAATSAAASTPPQPAPAPSRIAIEPDRSKIVVNFPEEAVGASSSVAIISRRSIALPASSGASALPSGKNVVVGKPLMRTVPDYPYEAQQQKVEGTVKLHATVGTDGTVRSVDPVSGPEALVEAATNAIREWRFAPTRLDGRAIDVQDDVTLFFRLPN